MLADLRLPRRRRDVEVTVQAAGGQPRGQGVRVEGDDRRDEGLRVAHDHHLRDEGVGADRVLQLPRGHVLAAGGDDDLLLPARDAQEALLVQGAQIAGAEPAVLGEGLLVRLGAIAVAAEQRGAACEDLAVVVDPDLVAAQRAAHGADAELPRAADSHGGGGLGEAVALEDRDAHPPEEVRQVGGEGAATGDRVLQGPAHGGADPTVDQRRVERALGPQRHAHPAVLERLRPPDRHVRTALEDRPLPTGLRLEQRRVVDLLEHARHGEQEGRTEALHRLGEAREVRDVAAPGPGLHSQDGHEAGEHVRQGDEQHRRRVGADHLAEGGGERLVGELREVGVRQLAALGPARGAGGVDHGGQGVQGEAGPPLCEDLVPALLGAQLGQARAGLGTGGVHGPQAAQGRQALAVDGVAHDLGALRGVDDGGAHAGVLEDPGHLRGRGRLVDRHRDGTGGPDGVVHEGPLEPSGGHDRHVVAGAHAGCHQTAGIPLDPGPGLGGRHIAPGGLALAAGHGRGEQRAVRVLGGLTGEGIGQGGVGGERRVGRLGDVAHGYSRRSCPGRTGARERRALPEAGCDRCHAILSASVGTRAPRAGAPGLRRAARPG